jgi:hypothetical protein
MSTLDVPVPQLSTESAEAVLEQAKGALMLRYGIGACEAFGILVQWSHDADVSVVDLAGTLMSGICLGQIPKDDPRAVLVRWLENRLRTDPEPRPRS